MSVYDMLLSKRCSASELQSSLACILDVYVEDVLVTFNYDYTSSNNLPINRVWCNCYDVKGDFELLINLAIEEGIKFNAHLFSQCLINKLNIKGLISGHAKDPFEWILLSPNKSSKVVYLKSEEMNDDCYVIDDLIE